MLEQCHAAHTHHQLSLARTVAHEMKYARRGRCGYAGYVGEGRSLARVFKSLLAPSASKVHGVGRTFTSVPRTHLLVGLLLFPADVASMRVPLAPPDGGYRIYREVRPHVDVALVETEACMTMYGRQCGRGGRLRAGPEMHECFTCPALCTACRLYHYQT